MKHNIFILFFLLVFGELIAENNNVTNQFASGKFDVLLPSDLVYTTLAIIQVIREEGFAICKKIETEKGCDIETEPILYDEEYHGSLPEFRDFLTFLGFDKEAKIILRLSIREVSNNLVGIKITTEYQMKNWFGDEWETFDTSDFSILERSKMERKILFAINQRVPHAYRRSASPDEILKQ